MGVENQVGQLYFDIDARTGKLVPELQAAENQVQSFGTRAQHSFDGTTASATRMVGSMTGVGGVFAQLAQKAGVFGLIAVAAAGATLGISALAAAGRQAQEDVGKIGEGLEKRGTRAFLESLVGKTGADLAELEAERTAELVPDPGLSPRKELQ